MRFSASDQWITECLDQAGKWTPVGPQSIDAGSFPLLVPLCDHESLISSDHFLTRVAQEMSAWGFGQGVPRFPCRSVPALLGAAKDVAGIRPVLRAHDVSIATENAFSRDFHPPAAKRSVEALKWLLRESYPVLAGRDAVGAALASYLVILTIHPFVDGNGRVARHYFASGISRHPSATVLLLALVLLHQRQSSAFHMACKIARAGDLGNLLACYDDGIALASSVFGDDLAELNDALGLPQKEERTRASLIPLMRIRTRAGLYLFH